MTSAIGAVICCLLLGGDGSDGRLTGSGEILTNVAEQNQDGAFSAAAAVLQEVQVLRSTQAHKTPDTLDAGQEESTGWEFSIKATFHPLDTFSLMGIIRPV